MKSNAATQIKIEGANIERLLATRDTYQALKKRLEAMAKTVDELESEVITQVEAGIFRS